MFTFPIGSLLVTIGFEYEPSIGFAVIARISKDPLLDLSIQGLLPFTFNLLLSKKVS